VRFVQLASGIDTTPVLLDLVRNADLWDQHTFRRTYEGSPHGQMVDIAVRYMPEADVSLQSRREPHRNIFWPAWQKLPALRPLVFGLMARVQAVELGSILLTKLPPGGEILPHSDAGSWAPEFYNMKAHAMLAGVSVTSCDGELCRMEQGQVFTFDNLLEHSIRNIGENDRICCIISMRVEP